jgi:hypothetical protein
MGNIFATSKLAPESDNEALEKATLTPTPKEIHTPPVPTPTTTPSPKLVEKEDLEDVDLEEKTLRPSTPHPLSYYNDLNRPISKLGQILKESLETADSIPFPVHRYPSVVTANTTSYNYLNTTNTNPNLNTISEQPTNTTDTTQTPLLYDQE